jgi:hypothetical protein
LGFIPIAVYSGAFQLYSPAANGGKTAMALKRLKRQRYMLTCPHKTHTAMKYEHIVFVTFIILPDMVKYIARRLEQIKFLHG